MGIGARGAVVDPPHRYASMVHGADALGDAGLAGHDTGSAWAAVTTIIELPMPIPAGANGGDVGCSPTWRSRWPSSPASSSWWARSSSWARRLRGRHISAMGEANIVHDVHAAERVLAAGRPTTMVTIDVTTQVIMTGAYLDEGCEPRTNRAGTRAR